MAKRLVVSDGSRERELLIVGRLVVGRDPACDITYDDALLSRKHAEFVASGDEVIVRDLGSRNGVFVNGAKIAERTLRSGDIVQVGPVRARYVADAVPVGIAPEQVDADYTAVIAAPPGAPVPPRTPPPVPVVAKAPAPSPAASMRPAPAPPPSDDDDRTRMITGSPVAPTVEFAPKPAAAPAPAADDDNDRTHFLKSPVTRPATAPPPATSGTGAQSRPASAASGTGAQSRPASATSGSGAQSRPASASIPAPAAAKHPAAASQPAAVPPDDAENANGATVVFPRRASAQSFEAAPTVEAPSPAARVPAAIAQPEAKPKPAAEPPQPAITAQPSASRPSPSIPPPSASVRAPANPQLRDSSLSSYVVARVVVLVVIVLAAAVVPLLMWRSAPEQTSLVWIAVPVAVAAIAAFAISAQINKRFADALAAERNRS